ncbi:MAG: TRAM domain-containing protein [Caldisericia bacterium]
MKMLQKFFSRVLKRWALTDLIILIFALIMTTVIYLFLEPILNYALQSDTKLLHLVPMLITPTLFIILWMIGVAKKDSITDAIRGFIGVSGSGKGGKEKYILDSSSLIDGRITDFLETNTLSGRFAVPSFVLVDLQRISDSPDPILAHRGKRGTKAMEKLQEMFPKKLEVLPSQNRGRHTDLLMSFVNDGAKIISCDREITDEIRTAGGMVINLNELASALKTVIVPGEKIEIRVIKEGKDREQGIGFLDDGTMVVVEDGKDSIGKTVTITCTSLLQNPQGRIVFGRINSL